MINSAAPDYTNTPVAPTRPHFGYAPDDPQAAPVVSIVTPFYNVGPVFHETAQSVFNQSLQQWEWLVVNDGTTDEASLAMLEHYRLCDPRVRVLDHEQNRGLSAARNTGFEHARTAYVVQLDGDDLLEPTAIEKWLWFLESYPECAFVKGYSVGFGAEEYLWDKGFHNGSGFLNENLTPATCMIRVAVHQAVGGYDVSIRGGFEDWDFWLRCAYHGFWGATIPEYLDWYRRRLTHADRWTNLDDGEQQRAFYAELQEKYALLWQPDGFPRVRIDPFTADAVTSNQLPTNVLVHEQSSVLLLLPGIVPDDQSRLAEELAQRLAQYTNGRVSIVVTSPTAAEQLAVFAQYTPDIFVLSHFLRSTYMPHFLPYLVKSRGVNTVVMQGGDYNDLLIPVLRSRVPSVGIVNYFSPSTTSIGSLESLPALALIDAAVVTSERQRQHVLEHSITADSITYVPEKNGNDIPQDLVDAIVHVVERVSMRRTSDASVQMDDKTVNQAFSAFQQHMRADYWQAVAERQMERAQQQQQWINQLEESRAWLQHQADIWQRKAEEQSEFLREQQAWIASLEQGKAWLQQQLHNAQEEIAQLTKQLETQRVWTEELENAKAWLEEQRANWQTEAERLTAIVAEQQQWIAELEQAKAWHEQQTAHWQAQAAHWKEQVERLPSVIRKLTDSAL